MRNFVFIILFFIISNATTNNMETKIFENGYTESKLIFKSEIPIEKNISFTINDPSASFNIYDKSGLLIEPIIDRTENQTYIQVMVPFDYLEINFKGNGLTSKIGPKWKFYMNFSSMDIDSLDSRVYLPNGAVIEKTEGQISEGLIVNFSNKEYEIEYKFTENNQTSIIIIGAILLIGIGLVSFFVFRKKNSNELLIKLQSGAIFNTLDSTDKEILEFVAKSGGSSTQAKINLNTNISKATLSRRLNSLEERKIITRIDKGNRKIVKLEKIITK